MRTKQASLRHQSAGEGQKGYAGIVNALSNKDKLQHGLWRRPSRPDSGLIEAGAASAMTAA